MSERADDDVRGEQRKAARQLKQQQQQNQRGEGSTAMATVAERRSLPSPEIMLGQPWSNWVDTVKLHGIDGAELEESLKECGKNREATRLCRDDMSIFGQCPAQDDFYLVMCNHCSQVVKPQAFQAHHERRHSSASKPPSSFAPSTAFPLSALASRSKGGGGGVVSGGAIGRSSSGNSTSSNSKILKPAKEKLPHRRPPFPFKVLPDDVHTPAVKVEKMHLKVDPLAKLSHIPPSSSSSSTSSTTVSSPMKPGLNCPSIPKPPLLAPGQIPNGKGHLSSLDKKQDSSISSRRHLCKRLSEREFNPDIHCGVLDIGARKPCTRSLTCKTHSLSQRRAVPGRRKRFDTLLAEHKSKAREKELQHRSDLPQQTPPLRDPHPSPSRLLQDPHQVSHGNGTTDATKPLALSKPKPHNPGLPRLNSSNAYSGNNAQGDMGVAHELLHHPPPSADGASRLSSDEGENEEREEGTEKLDCHYSGYHPRPAAFCTFGSRLFGRSCYSFDRRWDRVRCALNAMMDKHVNSQMWKKIPLALENSSSVVSHRTSTNSLSSAHSTSSSSSGFLSPSPAPLPPPYSQSYDGKSALSYGMTLNARASQQGQAEHPAYSASSRQVSSSPQMPSAHSSAPSMLSGRPLKSRSSGKSFRTKETGSTTASSATNSPTPGNTVNSSSNSNNSSSSSSSNSVSLSSGKKRKNSSLLMSHSTYATDSLSSSSSSSSSFKKNCAVNSGSSGSSYLSSLTSTTTSSSSSSSTSSHSGVYSVGLNCTPGRTNSLSLRQELTGRGPPSGSPAESIKRMSVVMNSSDSTLSLGPFVHQSSEHHGSFSHGHADVRMEGKKRKSSPASSNLNSAVGGGGGGGGGGGEGGGQGPGRPKMAKSPAINNIHGKHARPIPGTQGLPNNSLIHQPKARP
ncbi:ataxin-7 [Chanos chanos]|uniref:Ataxin-7 n=1 Tax=Chanos chanos TaxID=29144 RepID=A0A6J2VMX8_CHACN|nr:ataxin-7 [Chanos chanos]